MLPSTHTADMLVRCQATLCETQPASLAGTSPSMMAPTDFAHRDALEHDAVQAHRIGRLLHRPELDEGELLLVVDVHVDHARACEVGACRPGNPVRGATSRRASAAQPRLSLAVVRECQGGRARAGPVSCGMAAVEATVWAAAARRAFGLLTGTRLSQGSQAALTLLQLHHKRDRQRHGSIPVWGRAETSSNAS